MTITKEICITCNGTGCTFCDHTGWVKEQLEGQPIVNAEPKLCPVSQIPCEDYEDCDNRTFCHLK